MKKFLVFILVLSMVIGTGIMVSAVEPADMESVTFVKKLEAQGVNPAETFNFTIGAGTKVDGSGDGAPEWLDGFTIEVSKGESQGQTQVNLPGFEQVGIYEYEIEETAGSTAGMVYDESKKTLVVQVINGSDGLIRIAYLKNAAGEKTGDFTVANNSFDSGELAIAKVLEGNFTDPDDEFTVTVTLSSEKNLNLEAMVAEGGILGNDEDGNPTITYTVKGGDVKTIQNIPYGVSYAVEESNFGDYTPSYNNEDGEVNAEMVQTTITNTRNRDVDTGISLDNLPYIMTMVLALGGLVLFVVRKKRLN